jgi:quercetin dioxygenase-like cupin family protein
MSDVFPEPISSLPKADIPLEGVTGFLLQGEDQQIIFMEFLEDVELPSHSHEAQWGVVLEGRIDLVIGGDEFTFTKGDRYFIPEGVEHSGLISAGYADITYFNSKDRYVTQNEIRSA